MSRKTGMTLALAITCLLLGAFPAAAGEWTQTDKEQWQYILDDGTRATGWLELGDKTYYLDENGNRKSDYWYKDDGHWYYLDEDGVMAKSTWIDNYYVDENGHMTKKR
ncbi:MAG: hypothetical protein Q4C73_04640 [Eubacteriales bacterium]|nr:hypothetical protein [Eubacteriales bacterium]